LLNRCKALLGHLLSFGGRIRGIQPCGEYAAVVFGMELLGVGLHGGAEVQ
jgi:hypothetical protein